MLDERKDIRLLKPWNNHDNLVFTGNIKQSFVEKFPYSNIWYFIFFFTKTKMGFLQVFFEAGKTWKKKKHFLETVGTTQFFENSVKME